MGVTKDVLDRKSHGRVRLVNAVSFRIEPGAFVAVVGGSGTGKSTLLDCLNGLRPATDGGIYFDTNNYYDNIKSYKNVIGYVPQRDIMHDDLTVEDGLFYTAMLRMRSMASKEEIRAHVREAIADVRLTGREKLKISSLSGGQRKRVSIAMELLSDPKVIFLDEPTSGLSPDLDLEMMELLKELAGKGRTIVVITHAMENLDKCDKIAFLGKGGRLCFYGEQKEVFRYFNRKSYSRIFAALNDDTLCAYFEQKYRASDYYKRIHSIFCEQYADAKACMLPPVYEKKTIRETAAEKSAPAETEHRGFAGLAAELKAARRAKRAEKRAEEQAATQAPRPSKPAKEEYQTEEKEFAKKTPPVVGEEDIPTVPAAAETNVSAALGRTEEFPPAPAQTDGEPSAAASDAPTQLAEENAPPKKKRGRPKKVRTESEQTAPAADNAENTDNAAACNVTAEREEENNEKDA